METNTKKKIGLLGCIGTGIGAIIGSGIFGSLPTVINDIGTGIVLALLATIVYTFSQDDSKCLSVVGSTGIRKLFYRTDEADPSGGWCIYGGTESVTAGIDLCVCGVVW